MLKVTMGHSNDPDSATAIAEVLEQCRASLPELPPKAGILFAAMDFDHQLILEQIHQTFPQIALIGCTSSGEISSALGYEQDSLALLLLCSDDIEMAAGVGRGVSQNPVTVAQQAVEQATAALNTPPKLCITLPESLTVSCVSLIEGLQQALGHSFPIVGGFAADDIQFKQTYQFFQTEVLSDAIPILLLAGNFHFSHGIACGWEPTSQAKQVTKVEQNVIYEIDHQPALDYYEHYLAGKMPSSEYPLAVFEPGSEQFYLRGATLYDREQRTVTSLADVPENATVQIAQANRGDILAATQASIKNALEQYPGDCPDVALFFTCCCRWQLLGTWTEQEFVWGSDYLGPNIPIFGFYTYGEVAPLLPKGDAKLHHMTFVTLLLGTE